MKENHMKRNLQIILSASAASVLAFSAQAQNASNSQTDENQSPRQQMTEGRNDQLKDTAKASDIIGMAVKNNQDEKLGKVANLALDVESGRIVQVIISSGGFLGVGETLTPVPPGALHHEAGQQVLRLDVSTDKFNAAPKCDTAKWDEDTQSNRVSEVYDYYGQHPYFARDEYEATNNPDVIASPNTLPRNMDGSINTIGARQVDTTHNEEVARQTEVQSNADGTWTRTYSPNGRGANSAWCQLGYVQKESKLVGAPVNNLQAEKIGKVNNFIVDLPAGRIVAVIVSSGGYLGMDDELSAVPPTALKLSPDRDTLQLDTSKEMLANSPHFKASEWPDFNQSNYDGSVYQAYKVEPYFNTDATDTTTTNAQPDNTARNVRDRDGSSLTPLDQGNSQADIDTTSQIRKEIIAADGMSVNAKNVKIITMNGHVTLRGPVNSEDEKRQIGEIANRIAQTGKVDNQLEVTPATTSSNN